MINFFEKITSRQKKFLKFGFLAAILFLVLGSAVVFGKVSISSNYFSDLGSSFSETFHETFGFSKEVPAYELDLAFSNKESTQENDEGTIEGDFSLSLGAKTKSQTANILNTTDKDVTEPDSSGINLQDKNETATQKKTSQEKKLVSDKSEEVLSCNFYANNSPNKKVLFSEVAWMGNDFSANDEWLELFNNSPKSINLSGWRILNENGKVEIVFEAGSIPERSFYTLERTDDNSIPNSPADNIYTGALSNSGEWLRLLDAKCELVDEVDAKGGWEILGGDNVSRRTLERNLNSFAWQTSLNPNGTPKKTSSSGWVAVQDPVSAPEPEPNPAPDSAPEPPPADISNESEAAQTIFVTEIMAGSSISSGDEFIEIYNYGNAPVDLTGWSIKKKSSTGSESSLVAMSRLEGKIVPVGKYFLITHEGGYTGAVSADVMWPASYSLAYTNNSITIYNASGAVIDQVSWVEIPKDKSYARSSMDISAGFGVVDVPNPVNSQ